MDLYKEILIKLLENEKTEVIFPNLGLNVTELVESECYKALEKIKAVIENEALTNDECFMKIEEIICVFEEICDGCEKRHDFG